MSLNEITSHNLVLLTGAGFTKNFGGLLGAEMWSLIFNHASLDCAPRLKSKLTHNHDYESVYSEILEDSESTAEERKIIQEVVEDAYKTLDDKIRHWVFNSSSPYPVNWYGLQNLLRIFNGDQKNHGFYFTLNQDIFMERQTGAVCPGVPRFPSQFYSIHGSELSKSEFVVLPGSTSVTEDVYAGIQNHAGPTYVKLHGSYGWRSASGSNPMVVGTNKTSLIANEPILATYFDLFKHVLTSGDKRLLTIGYGFMDRHINEVIWNAAKNHGLKIYNISTTLPGDFRAGEMIYEGHRLWDSIAGYFPYRLVEIFPSNQEETPLYTNIRNTLLR